MALQFYGAILDPGIHQIGPPRQIDYCLYRAFCSATATPKDIWGPGLSTSTEGWVSPSVVPARGAPGCIPTCTRSFPHTHQ